MNNIFCNQCSNHLKEIRLNRTKAYYCEECNVFYKVAWLETDTNKIAELKLVYVEQIDSDSLNRITRKTLSKGEEL
jgi:late competence protein required for DNA uptake (superfamily II DNA/RNA helicase)